MKKTFSSVSSYEMQDQSTNDSKNFSFSSQLYQQKKKKKPQKLKFNTLKIYENTYFNNFEKFVDPTLYTKVSRTQEINNELLESIKMYNSKLKKIKNMMVFKKRHDPDFFVDLSPYERMNTSMYPDQTLIKSQRLVRTKLFELSLIESLFVSHSLTGTLNIDNVHVVYFSDFLNSDFSKNNINEDTDFENQTKECCLELPVLLSTGEIIEADQYFSNNSRITYSHNGNAFNSDFTSVPYINRFLSCIIHLKMANLKIEKTVPFQEHGHIEVRMVWVHHDDRPFTLRIPIAHYDVLVDFMRDHRLYNNISKQFVYPSNESVYDPYDQNNDFPVLRYKHFKKIFQSSFYYEKNDKNANILFKPVTSINNAYTIDLADFEEYDNSYKILKIDNFQNRNVKQAEPAELINLDTTTDEQELQSELEKANERIKMSGLRKYDSTDIVYVFGDEYFIPNTSIRSFIDGVMTKKINCNGKGEMCFGNY